MRLIFKILLFAFFIYFLVSLASCGKKIENSNKQEIPRKFKTGDYVCIMEKFNGVIVGFGLYGTSNNTYEYILEYVSPCGIKRTSGYEFQLSAGKCPVDSTSKDIDVSVVIDEEKE